MNQYGYLAHHGIKGQRWGIRRYQNQDGTLTPEGKKRLMYRNRTINAYKTSGDVNSIIKSMSKDDKNKLAIGDDDVYLTFEQGASLIKRIIQKDAKNMPASFFDILEDGDDLQIALGTRSGEEYRNKGYVSKAVKQGLSWYDKNKEKIGKKQMIWGVRTDNQASIHIAKKNGFVLDPNSYSDDGKWVNYVKK